MDREHVSTEREKLKVKDYDRELKKLGVELVKLQEWVKHKGLKICVVFEGGDGVGKGGTINATTDRVSTRVFRVVALPAPTERKKSQMHVQRYLPHLPAAGAAHALRPWLVFLHRLAPLARGFFHSELLCS